MTHIGHVVSVNSFFAYVDVGDGGLAFLSKGRMGRLPSVNSTVEVVVEEKCAGLHVVEWVYVTWFHQLLRSCCMS